MTLKLFSDIVYIITYYTVALHLYSSYSVHHETIDILSDVGHENILTRVKFDFDSCGGSMGM